MTGPGPRRRRRATRSGGAARWRFAGHILGVGTAQGTRVVVGAWDDSPLGGFADAMVERPDGHRILVAPTAAVAEFVAATYRFDEVRVEDVRVEVDPRRRLRFRSASLDLTARLGRRRPLGRVLRALPPRLAAHPAFTAVSDPVARIVMPGVRTRGAAVGGRREHYGATDVRDVVAAHVHWEGTDLGPLRDVDPPTRFGFSSTPRRPALTRVVTTVVQTEGDDDGTRRGTAS